MIITKNILVAGKHQKPILTDVFYNASTTPKPIVIFCHGYKGFKDWGAWNIMAETFANAGVFFVKFNFSHNGGTAEQPIDFPDLEAFGNNNYTKELDDLDAVIDWICSNKDYKDEVNLNRIILIGHSRGGGIVTIKAEEHKGITKVISLAGVCDFGKRTATMGDLQQWQKDGVKYVLNGRTKQQMPHYYQFYQDFINNEDYLTIKRAVSRLKIPYLILHGNKDTSVYINEAEQLYSWYSKSVLAIINNADHVFNVKHPWNDTRLSKELKDAVVKMIDFIED